MSATNTNRNQVTNIITTTKTSNTKVVDYQLDGVSNFSIDKDGLVQHLDDETVTAASPTLTLGLRTTIDSSSNAVNGTLGSGTYVGQVKVITMSDATNSSTISVTNHVTSDPEVFTFDAVDETAVLQWLGSEWTTIYSTATGVEYRVDSADYNKIVEIGQAAYTALTPKVATTLYVIVGA